MRRSQKFGALAQLGERLICIQEVRSSILLGSTKPFAKQKASPWQSLRSNDEKGSVTVLKSQPLRAGSSRAIPSECPAGTTSFAFGKISGSVAQVVRAHA